MFVTEELRFVMLGFLLPSFNPSENPSFYPNFCTSFSKKSPGLNCSVEESCYKIIEFLGFASPLTIDYEGFSCEVDYFLFLKEPDW
jgi:hypothetical protein